VNKRSKITPANRWKSDCLVLPPELQLCAVRMIAFDTGRNFPQ